MNWYKQAASDLLIQELLAQARETYGQDLIPKQIIQRYRQQTDDEIKQQIEWLKEEESREILYRQQKQEQEQYQQSLEDVPPEIQKIGGTKAYDSYTHCRSSSPKQIEKLIRENGGLPLTQGTSNVSYDDPALNGYNNIFVGCDEKWAAVLARDYPEYSGRFVYITFGDLTDDFYVVEDQNPMDKTNLPDSYIILSKQAVIPAGYIERIEDGGTWEKALKNRPDVANEFGEEYPQ